MKECENGFLFNPCEPASIVEALKRMLMMSDSTYHQYCSQSRKRAEELFSKEKFVNSYLNLIE